MKDQDISDFFKGIFSKTTDEHIVISRWCKHKNRYVMLSSNPSKNECSECIKDMKNEKTKN